MTTPTLTTVLTCTYCLYPLPMHSATEARFCAAEAADHPGKKPCPYCGHAIDRTNPCEHLVNGVLV